VEDRPDGGEVLVRYSATPRDAPCERLDVVVRLRGEMLLGEPDRQIELVWSTERAVGDDVAISLLLGTATFPLPSELVRSGSRAELTARAPPAALARYGSERRPTLVISDRKIELSERQASHLRRFLRRLPSHAVRSPYSGDRPRKASPAPLESDPASGQGWFCVEAPGAAAKERTSSCHRTAAECEESRAASRVAGGQVGECAQSPSAACYSWRGGASSGRACFYRLSHCRREEDRREDEDAAARTTDCRPVQ
jgi:hypothetical protein